MDFACKKIELKELIRCSFSLTKSEFIIIDFLIKNEKEEFSSKEISTNLKLDLSTVQRALKKMHSKELLRRGQKNLSPGGYIYFYQIKNKSEIKKKLGEIINSWAKGVENEIKKW
ncbi:MarR family transcriptional regulator [archaeon]|mgnify:FL=1|jgi:predicted transcriptional regulator|nr:MarR family transcriptional regulator [archaeon]